MNEYFVVTIDENHWQSISLQEKITKVDPNQLNHLILLRFSFPLSAPKLYCKFSACPRGVHPSIIYVDVRCRESQSYDSMLIRLELFISKTYKLFLGKAICLEENSEYKERLKGRWRGRVHKEGGRRVRSGAPENFSDECEFRTESPRVTHCT